VLLQETLIFLSLLSRGA